jgi:predicted permease
MLTSIYSTSDYLLAAYVVVPLLVWITFEFLGALRAVRRLVALLTGQTPPSAQEAAQRVSEASYAATRNDKQRRGN